MKSVIQRKAQELERLESTIQNEITETQNRLNNLQISLIGISYQRIMLNDLLAMDERDVKIIHAPDNEGAPDEALEKADGDGADGCTDSDCRIIEFPAPKSASQRNAE